MSDAGETLLREIVQHPDDDAPRLVYADWLEQRGDDDSRARAQLVHVQLELEHATGPRRTELERLERALLNDHGKRWLEPLSRGTLGEGWQFRRGFVEHGEVSAKRFVKVAELLFERAPLLRSVRFPEASNELVALAECAWLERLVEVDLHEMCRCGSCKIELELPALFRSPYARNVRLLVLAGCRIEDDNAERLAASELWTELRTLDLAANRITQRGLGALLGARFPALVDLSLRGNTIGDEGGWRIATGDAPWLDRLQSLDLRGAGITEPRVLAALRRRFSIRVAL